MKFPVSERLCSDSMMIPHDPISNDVLSQLNVDRGLKPNGLTIENIRENIEFYSVKDDLDRPAIASKVSGSLAKDVKSAVRAIKSVVRDRNNNKSKLF